ncbi:MAG: preprotein translocase subunit YajC [Sphingomonadales bacterium]
MFISPAYAQAATTAAAPDGMSAFLVQMMPLLLIFVVFWFLIFRPQQQRAKQHKATLAAVKRGDQVVTGGGLIGKVTKVDDDNVEIEIAPNVRVKAVKVTLTDVISPTSAKPAND